MVWPRCFLPRPIKKFSLRNGKKTEERNWTLFLDENTHVQLHMGFIHVVFLHRRCPFFFPGRCLPLLLFLFFFWFTRQACPVFFFFSFAFFFFWFRCDFLNGHDFYFLINLGDYFYLFTTFLVLTGYHFLIRVYA